MKDRIDKITEAVRNLQNSFDGKLVLTGSVALYVHGLLDVNVIPHDLDLLLVNPSDKDLATLKVLASASPVLRPVNKDYNSFVDYQFTLLIDSRQYSTGIFIVPVATDKYVEYDGVPINGLMNIIKAKRNMGRTKDFASFFRIMERLISTMKI